MTVHSLLLFDNGNYTEIAKEFDLSVHNSVEHPQTHNLVEDNYITFLFPNELDEEMVYEYADRNQLHLMESWELSVTEKQEVEQVRPTNSNIFETWGKPDFLEGYKMFRIHYWKEQPTHWVLNPEVDLFVFNSEEIKSMVLYN